MNPNFILLAIPFFLLTILAEYIYGRIKKKEYYNFEDFITNMNIGIGNQALNAIFKAVILMIYDYTVRNFAFFTIEASVLSFIACTVLYDFLFYWAHRWGHEWNLYWGAHIVHHQSEEYNLSVALRQSWFHNIMAMAIFMPLPFLGFDIITFGAAAAFQTLYQYWIHTRHVGKLGPLEWILNTPSHHRVHHATNEKYLDKNYGGVLIIWDRMFGTFMEEEEEPTYGITTQLKSWNPIWANYHFYVDLWKGMKMLPKWKDRFLLLFKGPEHLGKMLGQKGVEKATGAIEKYRTRVTLSMQIYVMFQFAMLIAGLIFYMSYFNDITWFYRGIFLALILLTLLNCGAILENKKWTNLVEVVRLLAFLPIYNIWYWSYAPDWLAYTFPITLTLVVGFFVWLTINWWYYNIRTVKA